MEREKLHNYINLIISSWNPVGIPPELASQEYLSYIPSILNNCKNEAQLNTVLKSMLEDMGISTESPNVNHDIKTIIKKIKQII